MTDLPAFLNLLANFPMVVVFPTPLTPTIIITYGSLFEILTSLKSRLDTSRIFIISSFKILFKSCVLIYLSLATLSSSLSIILIVVETPTSALIKISSSSSRKLSSTFDLPAIDFFIFEKKDFLDLSRPLSIFFSL